MPKGTLKAFLVVVSIIAAAVAGFVLGRLSASQPGSEEPILTDLRAMQSAQAAYSSMTGYYGTPECLGSPWDCIYGYPAHAPSFVPPALASLTPENGYVRSFYKGKEVLPMGPPGRSKPTYAAWAYTAVPESATPMSRSFCTDSTGRICAYEGTMPEPTGAQCSSPCERIRSNTGDAGGARPRTTPPHPTPPATVRAGGPPTPAASLESLEGPPARAAKAFMMAFFNGDQLSLFKLATPEMEEDFLTPNRLAAQASLTGQTPPDVTVTRVLRRGEQCFTVELALAYPESSSSGYLFEAALVDGKWQITGWTPGSGWQTSPSGVE